jgi:hypothetical protein
MYMNAHDTAATDATAAIAAIGAFGLLFLMMAFDGRSMFLDRLSIKQRWIGLVGANIVIPTLLLMAYIFRGVTPLDVWHGAMLWWHEDTAFCKMIAAVAWWVLLSPLQSLLTIFLIRRAHIKQLRVRYFSSYS